MYQHVHTRILSFSFANCTLAKLLDIEQEWKKNILSDLRKLVVAICLEMLYGYLYKMLPHWALLTRDALHQVQVSSVQLGLGLIQFALQPSMVVM